MTRKRDVSKITKKMITRRVLLGVVLLLLPVRVDGQDAPHDYPQWRGRTGENRPVGSHRHRRGPTC